MANKPNVIQSKKSEATIGTLACGVLIASIVSTNTSSANGIIEVNDSDWPPYFFAGQTEKPEGFAKELLKTCFKKNNVRAIFRPVGIKRAVKELKEGKLDINIYSKDKRRDDYLLFGNVPLFKAEYKPVMRSDDTRTINTLTDFDQLKIGNLAGLAHTQEFSTYLKRRARRDGIATVNSHVLNLEMLLAKKIDVFVNTVATVLWQARESGYASRIKFADYTVKSKDYYVAVSLNSLRISSPPEFIRKIDKCLANERETLLYKDLLTRYLIR